ncbi:MAG: hypothetical protein ACP5I1_16055 [Candidatus Hinthialibacter sp.]
MKKSALPKKSSSQPETGLSVFFEILLYAGGIYVVCLLAATLVAAISLTGKDVLYFFQTLNYIQAAGSVAAVIALGAVFYGMYHSNE